MRGRRGCGLLTGQMVTRLASTSCVSRRPVPASMTSTGCSAAPPKSSEMYLQQDAALPDAGGRKGQGLQWGSAGNSPWLHSRPCMVAPGDRHGVGSASPAHHDDALRRVLGVPLRAEGGQVAVEVVRVHNLAVRQLARREQVVPDAQPARADVSPRSVQARMQGMHGAPRMAQPGTRRTGCRCTW